MLRVSQRVIQVFRRGFAVNQQALEVAPPQQQEYQRPAANYQVPKSCRRAHQVYLRNFGVKHITRRAKGGPTLSLLERAAAVKPRRAALPYPDIY